MPNMHQMTPVKDNTADTSLEKDLLINVTFAPGKSHETLPLSQNACILCQKSKAEKNVGQGDMC